MTMSIFPCMCFGASLGEMTPFTPCMKPLLLTLHILLEKTGNTERHQILYISCWLVPTMTAWKIWETENYNENKWEQNKEPSLVAWPFLGQHSRVTFCISADLVDESRMDGFYLCFRVANFLSGLSSCSATLLLWSLATLERYCYRSSSVVCGSYFYFDKLCLLQDRPAMDQRQHKKHSLMQWILRSTVDTGKD